MRAPQTFPAIEASTFHLLLIRPPKLPLSTIAIPNRKRCGPRIRVRLKAEADHRGIARARVFREIALTTNECETGAVGRVVALDAAVDGVVGGPERDGAVVEDDHCDGLAVDCCYHVGGLAIGVGCAGWGDFC